MNTFEALYDLTKQRKEVKEEGSYTCYLFDKGVEKICKKIGEEATEVVIASMKDEKEELIGEIADLYYHVNVLMVEKGITLEDISSKLEKRSLKQGNLKQERKPIEKL